MDRHRTLTGLLSFSSRGGGSGVSGGGCGVMSITIDELDADLLGEGEFDLLASGGGQLGLAFGNGLGGILNLGDKDGPLLRKISTAHNGKGDGLVDTGLDGLGVGDGDIDIDGGDNGHVVSGFLSDLLAVVVSITTMSVSTISMVSGLADSDHLYFFLLFEGDLNSLGIGLFFSLGIRVAADFLGNNLNGLGTDSADNSVGEGNFDNDFDGQFNIVALSFNYGSTHFSGLNNIDDGAVVFGLFIAIAMVSRVSRGGVIRSRGIAISRSSWDCGSKGEEEGQDSECLHA